MLNAQTRVGREAYPGIHTAKAGECPRPSFVYGLQFLQAL